MVGSVTAKVSNSLTTHVGVADGIWGARHALGTSASSP